MNFGSIILRKYGFGIFQNLTIWATGIFSFFFFILHLVELNIFVLDGGNEVNSVLGFVVEEEEKTFGLFDYSW
jgi:hypothetical protein